MWDLEIVMKGTPAYDELREAGYEPFHFVMVEKPPSDHALMRAGGSTGPTSNDLYPVVGMRKWFDANES